MAKEPSKVCEDKSCDRPPRMAVTTYHTKEGSVASRVFYDDRVAPAAASRYCKTHGVELVSNLAETLVAPDDTEAQK